MDQHTIHYHTLLLKLANLVSKYIRHVAEDTGTEPSVSLRQRTESELRDLIRQIGDA